MKQIFCAFAILSIALTGTLAAQDAVPSIEGAVPEVSSTVTDTDNPGMGLLDQATEAKLRASTVADLSQVIVLCQRARKAGLSGENLEYCDQLLAATQLSRGLFLAQELTKPGVRTDNGQELIRRALIDLEEAVTIIKDQPAPYLQIALLNLLPNGNENRAKEALKLALQHANNEPEIQIQVVLLLANLEPDADKREAILETAAQNGNPQIILLHALTLVDLKQYDKVLKLLSSLNEKFRDNRELMMQTLELRCVVLLAMGNPEEALVEIEAAEKTYPNSPFLLEQKFNVFVELEKFSDALDVARKLQSFGESPQSLLREILVLNEIGKYDDAIVIVNKLQAKYPENESGWTVVLVEIYIKQGAYDKAMKLVEEQLNENPDELRWIATKNKVLSEQKNWEEAVNWLESCLQKEPDSRALHLLLIETLMLSKNYRVARERIKSLLEKDPDNPLLLHLDSQASISLGLHLEAVRILTKLVESNPEDYTSINNLAWILCTSPIDSIRNGRRAVELAEKAGELTNYKRAFVLSTLAAAYAEAGEFDKAREISLKSVEVAKKERGKTEEERKELLEHLQKEWDCFQQNMPFRELMEEGK